MTNPLAGTPCKATASITDDQGALANAATVVATVHLPDGTTTELRGASVANPSTGVYTATFATPVVDGGTYAAYFDAFDAGGNLVGSGKGTIHLDPRDIPIPTAT